MPGVTEEIERHARVRVSYQDLSGVEMIEEADGLLSHLKLRALCWVLRRLRAGATLNRNGNDDVCKI